MRMDRERSSQNDSRKIISFFNSLISYFCLIKGNGFVKKGIKKKEWRK